MDRYPLDFTTVTFCFTTHQASGAPVAPSSVFETADYKIFKNGSATEKTSTNGLTTTSAFNGTTGLHMLVIDTSNDTGDAGFWVADAVYDVVLVPDETVDGVAVAKHLGKFYLEDLADVADMAVAVRTEMDSNSTQLDAIVTDTAEIGTAGAGLTAINLPNQTMDIVGNITGNLSGSVGSVTALAANSINASALATDAVTEIQSGLATAAALATAQTAINDIPTNAELATALGTADDAVLAAIATVQADTDNIQTRIPAALVGGRMDSSVGAVGTGAIGATGFAANAIDATVLATTAVTEIANGLLDLTDGVETGLTPRNALKLAAAGTGGKISGAATTTVTLRNAVADSKNRMIATVDADGNRSAITYDFT